MKKQTIICLLALFVICGPLSAAQKGSSRRTASAVPDTAMLLPFTKDLKTSWAVPCGIFKMDAWNSFPFCVDGDGAVWLLNPKNTLICVSKSRVIKSEEPIDDFIWLKSGSLWVVSGDQLGRLKGAEGSGKQSTRSFQPLMRLPVESGALSTAAEDSFYLWGKNVKTGRFDVYLMDRLDAASGKTPRIRVLFSTDETITAVGGDGNRTYVALGPLVVQLAKNDDGKVKMRGVYKDAASKVNGLAVQPGVDLLFYATEKGAGYVDPAHRRQLEFIHSPGVGIAAGPEGFYVKLSEASGVVKIVGLSHFVASGKTASKNSGKTGHKSKHKNAK